MKKRIRIGSLVAVAAAAAVVAACGGSSESDVGAGAADGGDGGAQLADGGVEQLADGAVLDGGSPASSGPGGDGVAIPCGSVSCPKSSALCCAYPAAGTGTGFSYLCVGGTTCPIADAGGGQTPTVLRCTGTSNCEPGTVCCVGQNDRNQGAQSSTSACKPSCGASEAQLCDPAATPSGCAPGANCSTANIAKWDLPSTFATCGGVAPSRDRNQ